MKTIYYYYIVLILGSLSCHQKHTKPHASLNYKARKVIIVVIDGPRYSETWGDSSHQYIPHMAKDMAKEGAVFTRFYNNGYTYTNSGHTAITTGHNQQINNTGKEYPNHPSIFHYYLKKSGKNKNAAWLITSKDKLEILAHTKDEEWKDKFIPSTNCGQSGLGSGYRDDLTTFNKAVDILTNEHPDLVLINFKEPDASAHAEDWQGYIKGIQDTDNYIWQLWKLIQSDSNYKDQTAFFVTNDHGRHLDNVKNGFANHGCSCEGCRHINLYAYGPDFSKKIIHEEYALQDIAAMVADILKLEMPHSKGKVIEALLVK